jgi:endonuclease YncB( thermonuclease family)
MEIVGNKRGIRRPMGKVVNFQSQKPKRAGGISTILAAMGVAGAAGYFGPGILQKFPIPSAGQAVASTRADTIVGRASVIDGDTIEIHGERIRFNGVDAPESSQLCSDSGGRMYRCGARSADALSTWLAASSPTSCSFVERDQYGRFVGNCSRADGASVQRWLVRNGHAMDWPRYSNGAFSKEQAAAKSEKVGIWQGPFQPPWKWRAAQRQESGSSIISLNPSGTSAAVASEQSGACNIKGNISRKGERIYHVPGQKYYGKTRVSTSKGERWFCSEQEARAAGWRRSKQ